MRIVINTVRGEVEVVVVVQDGHSGGWVEIDRYTRGGEEGTQDVERNARRYRW